MCLTAYILPVIIALLLGMQAAMKSRQVSQHPEILDKNNDAQLVDVAAQRMARLGMFRHQQQSKAQLTSV